MRLKDRRAVVTGAAGGIGRALARGVASEGAAVVCVDRNKGGALEVAEELRAEGFRAKGVECDLANFDGVEQLLVEAVEFLGGVDAVFSNAGGTRLQNTGGFDPRQRVNFLEIEPKRWREIIDDNLTSAFNVGLVFARWMAKNGGGTFVFTTSQLSEVVRPGLSHYVTAKGGVQQLMRAMAVDLGQFGIRVNAFAPGPTRVPVSDHVYGTREMLEQTRREVPLGRRAEPDEMVGAAIFLASDEASFVLGATIMVDGGYTVI